MAASVEPYLSIVNRAFDGRIKLPAFQREWKWKTSQVILLFDSLRQGFPVGGFLFIKESPPINLAPRELRGASKEAEAAKPEYLVLDGQQRITAGLELFHDRGGVHYFLDLNQIWEMAKYLNLNDTAAIRSFLADLDAEDQYCIARKPSADPHHLLLKNHLLWTTMLTDDIELDRALRRYIKAYPEREDFTNYVIGKNFRPSPKSSIPVTSIDEDVTVEAISRIFATLNSTGKMLTPFELVVSLLFPQKVNLAEDVEVAREAYPYYGRIDATGDILLQTIALFAGRDTKKASLPKTIDVSMYRLHRDDALKYLEASAQLLTHKLGLGLDQSSELLTYPVVFSPMAFVLRIMEGSKLSVQDRAKAEQKLVKWFMAGVMSRHYQQSTHDKQAKDKNDIPKWIEGNDEDAPQWIRETYIPRLNLADPDGAIGKMLRAVLNSRGLKDPYTGKDVGVGSGKQTTAKHHIFPTRFVKNLAGWGKNDTANLAMNIMYVEQTTNAEWLNLDPSQQLANAIKVQGERKVRDIYANHGITAPAFEILLKPNKTREDYINFIERREDFFVQLVSEWGFRRPVRDAEETSEVLED